MEKQIIYLPRSTFWAKYSPQDIYKTIKTRSCLSTEERYSNYCLPRQLPNSGLLCRRFKSQHVANIGSSTLARIDHKLGGIHPGIQPDIGIPRSLHKLTSLVAQCTGEKDLEHTKQMSPDPFQPHPHQPARWQALSGNWTGSPGYLEGPPPLQVPSNKAHKISLSCSIQLRDPHDPQHQCTDRITMVPTECSNCKWESNQPPCPRLVYNLRPIQRGLGCMLQGLNRKRSLVSLGSQKPHKHSGTKAAFFATKAFLKDQSNISVCLRMENTTAVAYINNKGESGFPSACQSNSRPMAVVHSKVNSDHFSTSTRQTQHLGGQRIQRVFRLQRMANRPSNDSALHQRVHHRPVCLTPNRSSPTIFHLETRPRRYLHRRDDTGLGSSKRLRLSTVQSDFTSPEKDIPGQSGCGLSGASVAGTALVASPSGCSNGEP